MKKLSFVCCLALFGISSLVAQTPTEEALAGNICMSNGQFEEAQLHFLSAYNKSENSDSSLYYGSLYLDALERGGESEKIDSFKRVLREFLNNPDISNDIKSHYYTKSGWIAFRQNEPNKALILADSALMPDIGLFVKSLALSLKGTVLSVMGEVDKGLDELLLAEKIMDKLDYSGKDYGVTLMNIGNGYATKNNNLKSRDYFYAACEILMDYYGEQHPHYYIIKLFYSRELTERNEFQKANEVILECLDHFEKENDFNSLTHCYYNLTDNSLKAGDYRKALVYLEINLGNSKENGKDTTYNYAVILNTMVTCLKDLGRMEEAEIRLKELETLCQKYPDIDQWFYKGVMSNKALIFSEKGEYAAAEEIYSDLENYIIQNYGEDSEVLAEHHFYRADNFKAMGKYNEALKYHGLSTKFYNKYYDSLNWNNISNIIQEGKILEEMGNLDHALEKYILAKEKFDKGFGVISGKSTMANDFRTVSGRDELYTHLIRILALKSETGPLPDHLFELASDWMDEARNYYNLLISELFQVENTEYLIKQFHDLGSFGQYIYYRKYQQSKDEQHIMNALSLAELTKNYARRILLNDKEAKKIVNIPDSLLKVDRDFNKKIQYYESFLNKEFNEEVVYRLNKLRSEWDEFIDYLEEQFPKYYQLKYDPHTASAEHIQAFAKDNSINVLYYFKGNDALFSYLVNGVEVQMNFSPDIGSMDSLINSYRIAMVNNDVQEFYKSGSELYELTWSPWKNAFNHDHICVVPDGALSYLNFETLPTSHGVKVNSFRDMHYLINDYNIYYRYEFTSGIENQTFLNPVNETCENGIAFVPVFDDEVYKKAKVVSLPWSSSLAQFLENQLGLQVFEGKSATKENFQGNSSRADLLHFSTHAYTNDEFPMQSYLIFAGENNLVDSLTALEVIESDLKARLALLSACQTGLSEYKVGFGLQSLSWSFEYAGCKNFLVSLWSIDDESSAEVLHDFYKNLEKGSELSVTESLRKAKLDFLHSTGMQKANPFYWAGMIYIGNDMDLTFEADQSNIYWLFVLLPIVLILLFWRQKKKR